MTRKVFNEIYEVIKEIPKGKVMTYSGVAKRVGTSPRVVGFALNANRDPKIPCHRVVSKEGRLALGYALGGLKEQKRKLLTEGVKLKDEKYVNLEECLWQPERMF